MVARPFQQFFDTPSGNQGRHAEFEPFVPSAPFIPHPGDQFEGLFCSFSPQWHDTCHIRRASSLALVGPLFFLSRSFLFEGVSAYFSFFFETYWLYYLSSGSSWCRVARDSVFSKLFFKSPQKTIFLFNLLSFFRLFLFAKANLFSQRRCCAVEDPSGPLSPPRSHRGAKRFTTTKVHSSPHFPVPRSSVDVSEIINPFGSRSLGENPYLSSFNFIL